MTDDSRNVLITGASAGIGYELAKRFAREKYDLALVARTKSALDRVAEELRRDWNVHVLVMVKDLSVPGSAGEIADALDRLGIETEILVNNAGFGSFGPFLDADPEEQLGMMRLNMTALVQLTRRILPGMVARRSGRILNVASTAAFQPGPYMAVYYASKAFVLSFSEAIAKELQGTGVAVTALCPGPTITEFQKRAGLGGTRLFAGALTMDAAAVADIGYRGLMRRKTIVITGWKNRALAFAVRLTPRSWVTGIVKFLHRRRAE